MQGQDLGLDFTEWPKECTLKLLAYEEIDAKKWTEYLVFLKEHCSKADDVSVG